MSDLSPEVYASALKAAEILKAQLAERILRSHVKPEFVGPSTQAEIAFSDYPEMIGRFLQWKCAISDGRGGQWSDRITAIIPWLELFPLFRNAFAGIGVAVEHPLAQFLFDVYTARKFESAGRTVIVTEQNNVFVRPIGDVTQSAWLNAELRVDRNAQSGELNVACNLDCFEFGQSHGPSASRYWVLPDPAKLPTFKVFLPEDDNLPIARLVAFNSTTREVTFELPESVESYKPAATDSD